MMSDEKLKVFIETCRGISQEQWDNLMFADKKLYVKTHPNTKYIHDNSKPSTNKSSIESLLDGLDCIIHKDGSVDCYSLRFVITPNMLDDNGILKFKLNKAHDIICPSELSSFKNFPKELEGNLYAVNTKIKTLEHCPKRIGGTLNLSNNPYLESLVGCSNYIGNKFICKHCNKLKSLLGLSSNINGSIDCSDCSNLESLYGCPDSCKNFDCSECPKLESLIGCPKIIRHRLLCGYCDNLIDSKNLPDEIGYFCDCSLNDDSFIQGLINKFGKDKVKY